MTIELVMATASDVGMFSGASQHMLRNVLAIIVILHALSMLCPIPGASMPTDLQRSSCISSWRMVSIIRCFLVLSMYLIDLHALQALQPASCLIYDALMCHNVANLNEEGLMSYSCNAFPAAALMPCAFLVQLITLVHLENKLRPHFITSTVTLFYKVVKCQDMRSKPLSGVLCLCTGALKRTIQQRFICVNL